jgi:hypothetical protein
VASGRHLGYGSKRASRADLDSGNPSTGDQLNSTLRCTGEYPLMRITGTSIQKQNVNRGYEMADRIVILSDGTGNAASSVWRTNVWRIFQSLVLEKDEQAAKYDDGVGTSSFLPLAILGGVFGWGLKRNILDAYKFVCRNHEDNTKLYLFGFSRGAFTVRVLTAFMLEQGLVEADSESELDALARKAYRAYRANGYHSIWRIEVPFRGLRDVFVRLRDARPRTRRFRRSNSWACGTRWRRMAFRLTR